MGYGVCLGIFSHLCLGIWHILVLKSENLVFRLSNIGVLGPELFVFWILTYYFVAWILRYVYLFGFCHICI